MAHDLNKPIIDICCGSRMFWFDRQNPSAIFCDERREIHDLKDRSSSGGKRTLIINPDFQADFTVLPFPDNSFALVVFDPPHLIRSGHRSWLAKKYGVLGADWREELKAGFAEGFRVLKPEGVLVFKWNEYQIPVSQVLSLTPAAPLFGNRCGKSAKSHWIVFMKSIDY